MFHDFEFSLADHGHIRDREEVCESDIAANEGWRRLSRRFYISGLLWAVEPESRRALLSGVYS